MEENNTIFYQLPSLLSGMDRSIHDMQSYVIVNGRKQYYILPVTLLTIMSGSVHA